MSFISVIFHLESTEKDFLIVSRDLVLHCFCCQTGRVNIRKAANILFSAITKCRTYEYWRGKSLKWNLVEVHEETPPNYLQFLLTVTYLEFIYIFKIIGRILIGQKLLLALLSSLDTGATSPGFKNGGKMVFCKQLSKTECNIPINNLYFV